MAKYRLLRERILATGLVARTDLLVPPPASDSELLRAHSPDYVARASAGELTEREMRQIGFPWSPLLIERSRRTSGATLVGCRVALAEGVAVNLAGGTHHAFRDHGAGFCVFNDAAVAALAMLAEQRVRRMVIIDCDVHQGNGTAAILRDQPAIFTFSIHGAKNYPFHKEQSDLDIELADQTGDDEYLERLAWGVDHAIELSHAELAIYLGGADPYLDDRLGRLALTKQGLYQRDQLVFERLYSSGIPFVVTMAGGYARKIEDSVDIQFAMVELATKYTT
jgi:acetoin utilization deacetylase AcuC-like enzyme